MSKLHINSKGEIKTCTATQKACPYTEHFDNISSAEEYLAEENSSRVLVVLKDHSKSLTSIRNEIEKLDKTQPEGFIHIGKQIEGILGNTSRNNYAEELKNILESLQDESPEKQFVIHGPHSKNLEKALSAFPSGAVNLIKNDIYTTNLNGNTKSHEGTHVGQAIILAEPRIDTHTAFKFDYETNVGDYVTDIDFEHTDYLGFAVQKVTKPIGVLRDGDTLAPIIRSTYRPVERVKTLIEKGIIDHDMKIQSGKLDELKIVDPEWYQGASDQLYSHSYYVGENKPKLQRGSKNKYVKVDNSVIISTRNGDRHVNKPLYRLDRYTVTQNARTISAKKDTSERILGHEFAHALQEFVPSENKIFDNQKEDLVKDPLFNYYKGFIDDYMGYENGREVFTSMTERLFFPGNDFDETQNKDNDTLRQWAIGVWAELAVRGSKK